MSNREFADFYLQSRDRCIRAAVALGVRREEAEDAVAEAFARAWGRWSKVSTLDSPEAWVVRTAVNANISWWRKRRRESPVETLPDVLHLDATDRPDLVAALARLPRGQREVVVLRYLLDLDTRQTAAHLGVSTGTVTAQLHRALAALRSHLTQPERTSR